MDWTLAGKMSRASPKGLDVRVRKARLLFTEEFDLSCQ